jgi:predicted lipoprotein
MSLLNENVSRRRCLGMLLALPALSQSACRRPPRREEVLESLVREVMMPEVDQVVRAGRELASASEKLATAPSAAELDRVRAAWKRTALSWKRTSVFRDGPLTDTGALIRATYWPARRDGIDEILRAPHPIDVPFVENLGSDLKGMYGLEYLLFDREDGDSALARLSGEQGARSREWLRASAQEVRALGERAARAFGRDGRDYAAALSQLGQDGLNRVVSQMIQTVEVYATQRLSLVLWLGSLNRVRRADIEGGPSRISTDLAVSLLESGERLYEGPRTGGLSALVKSSAPRINDRVRTTFRDAIGAARGLRVPLEDAVVANRSKVEALMAAVKALEIALKSDLASALGVTLDFASGDAD